MAPCHTVQYAVDQAIPGGEIRVAAGTYTDIGTRAGVTQVVYISKTLTLRGGYTTDFTARNPDVYKTVLRPGRETEERNTGSPWLRAGAKGHTGIQDGRVKWKT